jgi:hypothetical protein
MMSFVFEKCVRLNNFINSPLNREICIRLFGMRPQKDQVSMIIAYAPTLYLPIEPLNS